jgi:hypothetical protein
MSTDRLKVLASGIRRVIEPAMSAQRFKYEPSTRTFRRPSGTCTQIVNFQAGVRSMEGQFTVNLGVYHPEFRLNAKHKPVSDRPKENDCVVRERLAMLRETPITRYFRPRIHSTDTFLKWWLVTTDDKWWPFTEDEGQVRQQLESLRGLLLSTGLEWLERHSDLNLLKAEYDKLRPAPIGDRIHR